MVASHGVQNWTPSDPTAQTIAPFANASFDPIDLATLPTPMEIDEPAAFILSPPPPQQHSTSPIHPSLTTQDPSPPAFSDRPGDQVQFWPALPHPEDPATSSDGCADTTLRIGTDPASASELHVSVSFNQDPHVPPPLSPPASPTLTASPAGNDMQSCIVNQADGAPVEEGDESGHDDYDPTSPMYESDGEQELGHETDEYDPEAPMYESGDDVDKEDNGVWDGEAADEVASDGQDVDQGAGEDEVTTPIDAGLRQLRGQSNERANEVAEARIAASPPTATQDGIDDEERAVRDPEDAPAGTDQASRTATPDAEEPTNDHDPEVEESDGSIDSMFYGSHFSSVSSLTDSSVTDEVAALTRPMSSLGLQAGGDGDGESVAGGESDSAGQASSSSAPRSATSVSEDEEKEDATDLPMPRPPTLIQTARVMAINRTMITNRPRITNRQGKHRDLELPVLALQNKQTLDPLEPDLPE